MKFKSNIEIQAGLEDAGGSPGTVNQLLSSTVTGTAWIDPSTIVAEAATLVVIACKNTSGAAIAQGTPVYQTGTVGATATIEIAPADALISANKLPAIGLLQTALNNNGFGFVVITGELTNFTTSPIDGVVPTTGDKVFVKSGGGLTLTKPTGEGNGIQNMGLVGKVSGGNSGSITVSSIMRTNDVPNLPEGRIWIGDGNTIVSDTVYVDEPNNRVGIGTNNPNSSLEVAGEIDSVGGDGYLVEGVRWARGNLGLLELGDWNSLGYDTSIFGANGNLAIRTQGGNVGIGTTNPGTYKLAVAGSTAIGGNVEVSDSLGGDKVLTLTANTGSFQIGDIDGLGGEAYIEGDSSNIKIFTSGTERVRVNSSGNVGIGTDNPQVKLHVANGTLRTWSPASGTSAIFESTANNRSFVTITGASEAELWFGNASVQTKGRVRYEMSTNDMEFWTNATQKMVINGSGNVGIGTTSPQSKLQVNGGVQLANDTASPSATKVGTFRYRTSGNNSYVDMCMQTGASTYAWVNIVTNSW